MPDGPFTAAGFADAVARLRSTAPAGMRLYCSLVPTQERRLRSDADGAAALASLDAVLIGGAPATRTERVAGVVETYGSTETSGGCVYDGTPLKGVRIDADADARILVSGPTLFDGYADGDDDGTFTRGGIRWLRMPDIGRVVGGRLVVRGRADDVIVTGGMKAHPGDVERALLARGDVGEAVVVPVPDEEWGQRVVALVVPAAGSGPVDEAALRRDLGDALPRHAVPKEIRVVESLPLLESGKIDRGAARALARTPTGGPRARDDA